MGIERKVLKQGEGAQPEKGQKVTVHSTGFLADGKKKFWSTKDTNEPFGFNVGLGQVIRGWDDGVMQMQIGETAELLMSADFAYGARGFPAWGIPLRCHRLLPLRSTSPPTVRASRSPHRPSRWPAQPRRSRRRLPRHPIRHHPRRATMPAAWRRRSSMAGGRASLTRWPPMTAA
jgi:peptidylprolyl isomerase